MDRRRFLLTTLAGVLTAPLAAGAQQAGKVYRIGFLGGGSASGYAPHVAALRLGLRDHGYLEGKNVTLAFRWAEGKYDRLPALAAELIRLNVDIIVTQGTPAALVAKRATTTLPIVMGFTTDPVKQGFVASLARPGGNITGVAYAVGPEIAAKRVELIKEAVPQATRIAVLSTPEAASQTQVHQARAAASRLGAELIVVEARDGDWEAAFAAIAAKRANALFVVGSPILNRDRKRIIALAANIASRRSTSGANTWQREG